MPKKNGITLIALIITIIVLVILAAVSISAVYNSKIINYATNGAVDYATESVKENEILDKTTSLMESAISNIESINAGNGSTSGSTEEPDEGDDEEPEQPPIEEPEVGIDFGDMAEDEITNNYAGKYVDYKPTSGSFSEHTNVDYSGSSSNSTISADTSLKWQILFADSNTLTLISDKPVHNGFYLGTSNGYNNGVLLLNNACKAMYSNSSLGATGRSLKIEDIESVSSFKGTDATSSYGKEYSPSNRYYPNIFAQEEGGAPNGTYGSLGRSEQSSYVTGNSSGNSSFKGKYTYYWYTMSTSYMNQKYVTLFNCSGACWLASRCVNLDSYDAYFSMFHVSGGNVDAYWLYNSYDGANNYSYAVRPVVEIDLSKANVGSTGDGGSDTPYSITAK